MDIKFTILIVAAINFTIGLFVLSKNIKNRVIPLFKRKLPKSINRKKDFRIFCNIIGLLDKKQTKEGLKKIMKLKSEMHK